MLSVRWIRPYSRSKQKSKIFFGIWSKCAAENAGTPLWCVELRCAPPRHTHYIVPNHLWVVLKRLNRLFGCAKESLQRLDSVESNAWYKTLIPLRQFNCQNVHNNYNNMISFISWYKMSSSNNNNNSTRVKPRRSASFLSKLRPAGQLKTSG